jgi:predicted nucleic acid-binding protein
VERIDLSIALGEVLETARDFGLTAYDASYLRLALQIGIPLATTDVTLSAACRQAGTPVLEV